MSNNLFDISLPEPQGKSNEWYTPAKYIEAARAVMGSIDLDPASCEMANRTVKATRYYTKEENGLSKEWYGNVWLNPPYGRTNSESGGNQGYTPLFCRKLLSEYQEGNVNQAIFLVLGNACFMKWFYPLWEYPMCFHDGRIYFNIPDGTVSDFGFGNTFIYLGPNEDRFIDIFSQFGRIAKAIDTPRKPMYSPISLWQEVSA